MQNPHEQQQIDILRRITATVDRLNESVVTMNKELKVANSYSNKLKFIGDLSEHYHESTQFNLKATGLKKDPTTN
ncbi:hypothetical protein TBLA_0A03130 [Henningerozyma blattae CBS 6284]|uniref:DASH complex subunit DAD4 n=1 Tax=Henningerozyma blattae (strain ATCC 34711 / CBS 6284 / DSM 70876 / NBRC 10599 / NRRL Y-10934 / UCD 77-7) TaxID=1071380 RepID=I2GVG1_HENB6|nr:hypothetical protein TBLA_0A03130 [Tetrapisispora blattae CBS 6284]CCH58113.1 hypothetical protein TBLA_0A03130 [Tetrapisispora blattae CBS 6284]